MSTTEVDEQPNLQMETSPVPFALPASSEACWLPILTSRYASPFEGVVSIVFRGEQYRDIAIVNGSNYLIALTYRSSGERP
jgi:hypothetical protein